MITLEETLRKGLDFSVGTRICDSCEENPSESSYGKIMGINVSAGTVNIRWEGDYQDSYDIPYSQIYLAQ